MSLCLLELLRKHQGCGKVGNEPLREIFPTGVAKSLLYRQGWCLHGKGVLRTRLTSDFSPVTSPLYRLCQTEREQQPHYAAVVAEC